MRAMRRSRQALSKEACETILNGASSGVLALGGDEVPYALPISFAYRDGALWFHCAPKGEKLDRIDRAPMASFCVIGEDSVVPEKFTTVYQSVIASGRLQRVEDQVQKRRGLEALADKYSPDVEMQVRVDEIEGAFHRVTVLKMDIDSMSGKEAIERVRRREAAKKEQ